MFGEPEPDQSIYRARSPEADTSPAYATVPWTGTSSGSLTVGPTNCTSGTLTGQAAAIPAGPLNTVTSSTWSGCTGPGPLTPTVSQVGTWTFSGASVTGVSLHLTGSGCGFTLSGSLSAVYSAAPQTLTLSGSLTTSGVTGVICPLIPISNGDVYPFGAKYHVT